jgi:hypothetical protein
MRVGLGEAAPQHDKRLGTMQKRSSGGCSSFLLLLFFVFLVLKLAGTIDWSWWWVFSPLWLPGALLVAVLAVLAVTGVSVYKIVGKVLKNKGPVQTTGQDMRPGGGAKPDILEAEGSEVPPTSAGASPALGLPPAPEAPAGGGSPGSSTADSGGPSV